MDDVVTERTYYFSDLLEMDMEVMQGHVHIQIDAARMCNAPVMLAILSLPA